MVLSSGSSREMMRRRETIPHKKERDAELCAENKNHPRSQVIPLDLRQMKALCGTKGETRMVVRVSVKT